MWRRRVKSTGGGRREDLHESWSGRRYDAPERCNGVTYPYPSTRRRSSRRHIWRHENIARRPHDTACWTSARRSTRLRRMLAHELEPQWFERSADCRGRAPGCANEASAPTSKRCTPSTQGGRCATTLQEQQIHGRGTNAIDDRSSTTCPEPIDLYDRSLRDGCLYQMIPRGWVTSSGKSSTIKSTSPQHELTAPACRGR